MDRNTVNFSIADILEKTFDDFIVRINEITAIADINEELVVIARRNLEHLKADIEATGHNTGILNKVNTQLLMYRQVARIPELASKFPILRGQMIVLIIGALEALFSDIFRNIAKNDPSLLKWTDKNEKISFDPAILTAGFSLGDAFINHLKIKGYSFQDLKSAIEAINKYLGINYSVDEEIRDELILAAASRNVIVHNKSIVDYGFLKQVRNTRYANLYKFDDELNITDDDINSLMATIVSFTEQLKIAILAAIS